MGRRPRNKKSHRKQRSVSDLSAHSVQGKRLLPPLRRIPNVQTTSWTNDRLPELIWAALLATQFPREEVIELFRSIASRIHQAGEGAPRDLRLTGIAADLPRSGELIVNFVCGPSAAKDALSPLLLFPDLPARQIWAQAIERRPKPDAWHTLAVAVAEILNHQSLVSTDIRWARVLCLGASGRLHLTKQTGHIGQEIMLYPYFGREEKVRPTIRAMEQSFDSLMQSTTDDSPSSWPLSFWNYCLNNTACFPLPIEHAGIPPTAGTTVSQLSFVSRSLLKHCVDNRLTSAVDPRHDSVFGMALYSLAILSEQMHVGASTSISARFGLRVLLEVYVTLAYLLAKDDMELWRSYRVYGAGQAKLAALKLEEAVDHPLSISVERLRGIANEDIWEEFLDIDLGHWAKVNLRQLAMDAGVKEEYDRFYPWTSTYTHGHWNAVRSVVFDTCGNPLHRLHRIPRGEPLAQPDSIADAVELVDKTLILVNRAYPGFPDRLGVTGPQSSLE